MSAWIKLFEGETDDVEWQVNTFLNQVGVRGKVIDIEYNYQAPEYDGQAQVGKATHGVLILVRDPEDAR